MPLALTGPTISDEGGEAAYTLTLRNTTNHSLAGPLTVVVTPSPGLVFTDQSVDGWSCTQPQAVGLLCVWPTELPAGVDSDAHTLRFTLAPPFSLNCGTGPSPCVSLLATVYDDGAAARVTTTARALVGGTLNTPPVPQNDTAPIYGTATAVIRVLDNDTDPDGDALRVTRLLEFPRFGDATINADGTITYTPTDTLPQPDTLRYEVSDERVPTAATASAVVTLTPSVPPLTASKTRLDLGPLAPRRIATGRFSLRSPVAMEVRIELQPVTAAEIAAALQGTAYDPAQAVSDPDAFRSDGRLSIDPLYSSAYVVGVHYQAPPSVGRVSVARVQIIGEPPGLAPVTRSLLIVAEQRRPGDRPAARGRRHHGHPGADQSLVRRAGQRRRRLGRWTAALRLEVGCMSAFPDTDCFVPANMAATGTLPASITGPQDLGFATTTTVTGTATVMYAVSELDACVGAPQPGDCQLEGNMYYGYLSVDVGGTPPDLSLAIVPATQTVAPGDVGHADGDGHQPGPGHGLAGHGGRLRRPDAPDWPRGHAVTGDVCDTRAWRAAHLHAPQPRARRQRDDHVPGHGRGDPDSGGADVGDAGCHRQRVLRQRGLAAGQQRRASADRHHPGGSPADRRLRAFGNFCRGHSARSARKHPAQLDAPRRPVAGIDGDLLAVGGACAQCVAR